MPSAKPVTKSVTSVKKKPAAAQVMTKAQVKKMLDERDDFTSKELRDLGRAVHAMHSDTCDKLKHIRDGLIQTYNDNEHRMVDAQRALEFVYAELKRQGGPINPSSSASHPAAGDATIEEVS